MSSQQQQQLLDLPDEILLMIFKELNMVDVFYFFANVNQRLNRIVHDSLYIRQLDVTHLLTLKLRYDQSFLSDDQLFSLICKKTLPRIHNHVCRIIAEPFLFKEILAAVIYPQLYSLSLRNFQEEVLYRCLTGMFVNIYLFEFPINLSLIV